MARIFVCGDIVNYSPYMGFVGESLAKEISKADYSVCNLEGPELELSQRAECPHQENGTISYLKGVGFDLFLLANNHITELGQKGLQYSIKKIKEAGVDYIGAGCSWNEAYTPIVKNIAGLKIGFINICEAQPGFYQKPELEYGYAWMGYKNLFSDVEKLASETDRVVVFVHAGLEHYDIPIPEIRDLYKRLCDSGASAVIGGHPHCAQGWETYNDSLIVYSLGNFFFPPRTKWQEESYSYSVILDFHEEGGVSMRPIIHYNDGSIVDVVSDSPINVDELNNKLLNNYDDYCKTVISDAYNKLCHKLIVDATCGQNETDGYKAVVKKALTYTLLRNKSVMSTLKERNALLLHLFQNETYRWTIIKYLKEIYNYEH